MSYPLHFLPDIEEDVLNGYSWYESKSPGLGEEFLRSFYACANQIAHNPLIHQKVHEEFRRRLLRRFPYALYFQVSGEKLVVFGLFHCARDPRTVKKQLSGR